MYVWSMGAHDRKVPVSLFKKPRDFAAKLTQFGTCSSRQSVRQLSHVTLSMEKKLSLHSLLSTGSTIRNLDQMF